MVRTISELFYGIHVGAFRGVLEVSHDTVVLL